MGYLSNAGLSYFFGKLKTIFAPISHGHGGATQSAAGFMSAADKKKLDGIAEGANKYSLPTATSNVLGGVKTGANITNNSGVLSVTAANVTNALGYTPPKQDTDTWRPVVNSLTSSATDQSLAANQGKILNESKAAMIVLTNENLNDVVTPGFYSSGGSNSVTNKPSNVDHFGLIVIHRASGGYYTQIIYSDSAAYRRHCVNGTWSGWVQDKLTDTDTWRGIQNNLTSDSTTDSLSAAQGKVLKDLIDGKAPASHTHSQYYDSTISRTKGTVLAAPASANGGATFRTLTKSDVGLGSVDNTADSAKSVKAATKLQTYKQGSTTETYGDSYPLYAQWSGQDVFLKCDNYAVWTDRASVSNSANAVAWGNVTDKPSTFTPSSHTHNYAGSSSAGGAATSANKVNAALTINLNGTSQGAWDGSSAKSISITAASVGATSVTISRW